MLSALCAGFAVVPLACGAQSVASSSVAGTEPSSYEPYTAEQLDNLLARIALYPDPLLAQVLIAATFPDQIDEAARWVRSYGQNGIDDRPWDVSVRAVAHYPTVLNMMDDDLDWTTAVGQAYAYQSTDVMASIQRLRGMARAQGNLITTPQQEVVVAGGYISIWPASALYLYVPVYDPALVFFRRVYFGGVFTAFSFGTAWNIGVWLNLDCDWARHRIYYTAWKGGGWIARSRPHIRPSLRYVDPRYSTIVVNRRVIQRQLNYTQLSRYRAVHRNVNFENRSRHTPTRARPPEPRVPNKIIDRNIPSDQRLDLFRGHRAPEGPPPTRAARPVAPRTAPAPARPQPRPAPPRQPRAAPQQRPAPAAPARPPSAFGRGDGLFDSRAASQRGAQSREQMQQRTPARRSAPQKQRRQPPGDKSR